jgi:hypothetical protein
MGIKIVPADYARCVLRERQKDTRKALCTTLITMVRQKAWAVNKHPLWYGGNRKQSLHRLLRTISTGTQQSCGSGNGAGSSCRKHVMLCWLAHGMTGVAWALHLRGAGFAAASERNEGHRLHVSHLAAVTAVKTVITVSSRSVSQTAANQHPDTRYVCRLAPHQDGRPVGRLPARGRPVGRLALPHRPDHQQEPAGKPPPAAATTKQGGRPRIITVHQRHTKIQCPGGRDCLCRY